MCENDPRLEAEIARLNEIEGEKRFLLDKSIGGPDVPRPTDKFILDCLGGPLKSEAQIKAEARENVEKAYAAEKRARVEQENVRQSMIERYEKAQARKTRKAKPKR